MRENSTVRNTLNSLRPSCAHMRQQNIPTLVQIMACRLFDAKPLSEKMSTAIFPIRPKGAHLSEILFKIQECALENVVCELDAMIQRSLLQCTKLIRMWNRLQEQTGYPVSLLRACLPEPTEPGVSQWKSNQIKTNGRRFAVVSVIIECWHIKNCVMWGVYKSAKTDKTL